MDYNTPEISDIHVREHDYIPKRWIDIGHVLDKKTMIETEIKVQVITIPKGTLLFSGYKQRADNTENAINDFMSFRTEGTFKYDTDNNQMCKYGSFLTYDTNMFFHPCPFFSNNIHVLSEDYNAQGCWVLKSDINVAVLFGQETDPPLNYTRGLFRNVKENEIGDFKVNSCALFTDNAGDFYPWKLPDFLDGEIYDPCMFTPLIREKKLHGYMSLAALDSFLSLNNSSKVASNYKGYVNIIDSPLNAFGTDTNMDETFVDYLMQFTAVMTTASETIFGIPEIVLFPGSYSTIENYSNFRPSVTIATKPYTKTEKKVTTSNTATIWQNEKPTVVITEDQVINNPNPTTDYLTKNSDGEIGKCVKNFNLIPDQMNFIRQNGTGYDYYFPSGASDYINDPLVLYPVFCGVSSSNDKNRINSEINVMIDKYFNVLWEENNIKYDNCTGFFVDNDIFMVQHESSNGFQPITKGIDSVELIPNRIEYADKWLHPDRMTFTSLMGEHSPSTFWLNHPRNSVDKSDRNTQNPNNFKRYIESMLENAEHPPPIPTSYDFDSVLRSILEKEIDQYGDISYFTNRTSNVMITTGNADSSLEFGMGIFRDDEIIHKIITAHDLSEPEKKGLIQGLEDEPPLFTAESGDVSDDEEFSSLPHSSPTSQPQIELPPFPSSADLSQINPSSSVKPSKKKIEEILSEPEDFYENEKKIKEDTTQIGGSHDEYNNTVMLFNLCCLADLVLTISGKDPLSTKLFKWAVTFTDNNIFPIVYLVTCINVFSTLSSIKPNNLDCSVKHLSFGLKKEKYESIYQLNSTTENYFGNFVIDILKNLSTHSRFSGGTKTITITKPSFVRYPKISLNSQTTTASSKNPKWFSFSFDCRKHNIHDVLQPLIYENSSKEKVPNLLVEDVKGMNKISKSSYEINTTNSNIKIMFSSDTNVVIKVTYSTNVLENIIHSIVDKYSKLIPSFSFSPQELSRIKNALKNTTIKLRPIINNTPMKHLTLRKFIHLPQKLIDMTHKKEFKKNMPWPHDPLLSHRVANKLLDSYLSSVYRYRNGIRPSSKEELIRACNRWGGLPYTFEESKNPNEIKNRYTKKYFNANRLEKTMKSETGKGKWKRKSGKTKRRKHKNKTKRYISTF